MFPEGFTRLTFALPDSRTVRTSRVLLDKMGVEANHGPAPRGSLEREVQSSVTKIKASGSKLYMQARATFFEGALTFF